jgi:hypothetical protein
VDIPRAAFDLIVFQASIEGARLPSTQSSETTAFVERMSCSRLRGLKMAFPQTREPLRLTEMGPSSTRSLIDAEPSASKQAASHLPAGGAFSKQLSTQDGLQ